MKIQVDEEKDREIGKRIDKAKGVKCPDCGSTYYAKGIARVEAKIKRDGSIEEVIDKRTDKAENINTSKVYCRACEE